MVGLHSSVAFSRQHLLTGYLFPKAIADLQKDSVLAGYDYSALSASTGLTAAARAAGR